MSALDDGVRAQEVEVVERVRVEVAVGDARRDERAPEVGPLAPQLLGRVEAVRELRGARDARLTRLPDAVQHLHLQHSTVRARTVVYMSSSYR